MRANFEEIKSKIKTIEKENLSESNIMSVDSDRPELKSSRTNNKLRETERERVLGNKIDEINNLGGKLYEKLIEKVNYLILFI
jgi:hypothetical protein